MTRIDRSVSFYFFDIDDNLLVLPTKLYLWNAETKEEMPISSGDFVTVESQLGRPGKWSAWAVRAETFRDFNDKDGVPVEQQAFLRDLHTIVETGGSWRGPSWSLFVHAAEKERPIACVTARGHSPSTIEAGLNFLAEQEKLPKPNVLRIYPVTNSLVRKGLGADDPAMTIPSVKKLAIKDAVAIGLKKYGANYPHRFGMSDDDPANVALAISAMRDCKEVYPDKRFFVINTNAIEFVKLEIFPMMDPVTAKAKGRSILAQDGDLPLGAVSRGGTASIYIADMDRAVKFYTDGVGLFLRERIASEWAELDAGNGFTLGLHVANPPITPKPGQGGAINIELKAAETLEVAVKAMTARGVTFKGQIMNYPNVRIATLSDPDGNDILLVQQLYTGPTDN